jgi:hypothetical protein
MCRLATGGGFGTRELYTNDEEQLFDSMRPVVLTGIEAVATRPDLLDRSILLELPSISKNDRKTEEEVYAALEPLRPSILGTLLDAVSCALKNLPAVKLPSLPRMADFATWASAAEPALGWTTGTFLAAYHVNQDEANDVALEAYPIVEPLRKLMADRVKWEGKSSELLSALGQLAGETVSKAENWPRRANTLSGQLKRLAPNLRKIGLSVSFGSAGRGRAKHRRVTITTERMEDSSSPSSPTPETQDNVDDPCAHGDDHCPHGDDTDDTGKAPKHNNVDDGNDGDDRSPPSSESHARREVFEV